ncbi:cyclic peptide export ABC transporter [Pseudoalteromonas rubra]|uniref:cyclic peptide export ABC transporter n=1 Tax=Pseudoalteromonas rubra TaxID=43658 RepID=UPI0013DD9C17|nr:cyclic peptide export ABC transporter [Pseudoalteromonas rubra]
MVKEILSAHKRTITYSLLLSVISGLIMTTILYRVNIWMGDGMTQQAQGRAWMFILAAVLCGISLAASHYLVARLSTQFLTSLRLQLLKQLLKTRVEKLEQLGSSQLYSRLTLDINALSDSLAVIPNLLYNLIIVSFLLTFMWLTSEPLFYAFIGFLGGVFILVQLSAIARGNQFYQQLRDAEEDMYECYRGVIFGAKELATSNARRHFFEHKIILPVLEQVRRFEFKSQYLWSVNNVASQTATFIIIGIMAMVVDAGYASATHLVLFVLIILYLMGPLLSIFSSMPLLSRAYVSYQRLQQVNEDVAAPVSSDKALPNPPPSNWQSLHLEQLSYQYDNDDYSFTLGPLSLTFNRGEVTFIVGGNGSGKSTLFRLIAGLYGVQKGQVRFDTHGPVDTQTPEYRDLFGCIFTDFYLFREVIDHSGEFAAHPQVQALLEQMRLDHKVSYDNGRLSQLDLSTGQRKRLAYLLCTLQDKPVYLFDEWAADQDPEFKHYFYTEILPMLRQQGKTVIVISHDDRYENLADQRVVLRDGQLHSVERSDSPLEVQIASIS